MSKENLIGLLFNCEVMSNSFVTPWTIIHQASLSMGFPSQEYRNGLSFLLQGLFHTQVSNPCLPPWQADSLPLSNQGSPSWLLKKKKKDSSPHLTITEIGRKNYVLFMTFERKNHWAVSYQVEINLHSRRPEQTDCNLQNDSVFSKIVSRNGKDAYNYKISAVRSSHRLKMNYCINIYYKSRSIDRSERSSKSKTEIISIITLRALCNSMIEKLIFS